MTDARPAKPAEKPGFLPIHTNAFDRVFIAVIVFVGHPIFSGCASSNRTFRLCGDGDLGDRRSRHRRARLISRGRPRRNS